MQQPIEIETYKDLPIPYGWPLDYVIPAGFAKNSAVVVVNGAPVVTGPASLSHIRLTVTAILVLSNVLCFTFLSHAFFRRYTILIALTLPAVYAGLITTVKLVGKSSIDAAWMVVLAVYFIPSIAVMALAVFRIGQSLNCRSTSPAEAREQLSYTRAYSKL